MIFLFKIGFLEVSWLDILDIMLVAALLYNVYKLMRGSVAIKIFLGFLSIYLIYLVVRAAQMELLSSILGQFMGVGVLAMIILFTPELRKFLLMIGKSAPLSFDGFFKGIFSKKTDRDTIYNISSITEACKTLGGANTGALIVISKTSGLKFYSESGDLIDAEISKRLLISIFNKYSPLHDGAVIIYKGRIKAARSILPVSENDALSPTLGLRHRAAIGMTEITDTMVIVVSEETGQISTANHGQLLHNMSIKELRKNIYNYLMEDDNSVDDSPADQLAKSQEIKAQEPVLKEATSS